ncbi:MAG: hypothetical protein M3Z75_00740 [Actinomycetota bacterium]|nr:hypothetical protein [Actinomycetota bacterium]
MDRQRRDREYAGVEFEPVLPPSPFVAELARLRPGRALDLPRSRCVPAIAIGTLVRAERPGPDTGCGAQLVLTCRVRRHPSGLAAAAAQTPVLIRTTPG